MLRKSTLYTVPRRFASSYAHQVEAARTDVNGLLSQHDRSSFIISKYIPEPARDAFIAIRGLNIEISKISNGGHNDHSVASRANQQLSSSLGFSMTDMKFKFWSDLLGKIFIDPSSDKDLGEPIAILLRDSIRNGLNLELSYFHQYLQTKKHFLSTTTFNTVDDICSYGEGSYSQLNYLTQGLLLSPNISPSAINLLEISPSLQSKITDIAAHIGQATAIGSMILGSHYYASSRNQITLPVDLMTKHELSQETLFRLTQGHLKDEDEIKIAKERLKEVVYETAITANDHLLTARNKLADTKKEIDLLIKENPKDELLQFGKKRWRKSFPDAIFTPLMIGIPTKLYLSRLEKYDFDIYHPNLQAKEWRLSFASFWDYYQRKI